MQLPFEQVLPLVHLTPSHGSLAVVSTQLPLLQTLSPVQEGQHWPAGHTQEPFEQTLLSEHLTPLQGSDEPPPPVSGFGSGSGAGGGGGGGGVEQVTHACPLKSFVPPDGEVISPDEQLVLQSLP